MFEPQVYFASKNLLLMHQVYLYTLTLGKSCNTNTHDDDDNNVEGENEGDDDKGRFDSGISQRLPV
jgi:hypothetical protein